MCNKMQTRKQTMNSQSRINISQENQAEKTLRKQFFFVKVHYRRFKTAHCFADTEFYCYSKCVVLVTLN